MKYLVIAFVLMMPACASTVATQGTSYLLPTTPEGRMCSNQCSQSHDFCLQSCGLDYRACYNEVQIQAQRDYDTYTRDHFAVHAPVTLFPSDFEHPQSCLSAKKNCLEDCETPYVSCYRSCGGTVATTSSCQFLCF